MPHGMLAEQSLPPPLLLRLQGLQVLLICCSSHYSAALLGHCDYNKTAILLLFSCPYSDHQ